MLNEQCKMWRFNHKVRHLLTAAFHFYFLDSRPMVHIPSSSSHPGKVQFSFMLPVIHAYHIINPVSSINPSAIWKRQKIFRWKGYFAHLLLFLWLINMVDIIYNLFITLQMKGQVKSIASLSFQFWLRLFF